MTDSVFFWVEVLDSTNDPEPTSSAKLSPTAFKLVRNIVSSHGMTATGEPVDPARTDFAVKSAVRNPHLIELLKLIKAEGWNPWPYYPQPADIVVHHRFWVRTFKSYTAKELSTIPFLWPQEWGKRWMVERVSAEWLAGRKVCRVSSAASGWEQRNGLAGGWNFVVHEEVRKGFAEAGLKGLGYERLLWDDPKKAKADFWLVTPSVLMPPCLTPVWDKHGKPDFEDGLTPPELRFDGNEVKALGEFDAAWTREVTCLGHPQLDGTHRMVVSQRFREVAKKLKLHVTYAPVRLDTPPPELPWFFTSDSPPANA